MLALFAAHEPEYMGTITQIYTKLSLLHSHTLQIKEDQDSKEITKETYVLEEITMNYKMMVSLLIKK